MSTTRTILSEEESESLLQILQKRFEKHKDRHESLTWPVVLHRLSSRPDKLWSLFQMEASGGEPDLAAVDAKSGELIFYDFSPESPKGRRSTCYDRPALESRKDAPPAANAMDMAAAMGIQILDEQQYNALQQLAVVDLKTSSWLYTPDSVRGLGGAIFGDFRYGRVFIYHNGAQSYYAARGFRGVVRV